MTSVERFRARFPIFAQRIYVNSCSQGALSLDVDAAIARFTESWRTRGSPWDEWVSEVERLRAVFAASIGADADEIAVMPSASTAMAAVATSLTFDEARRDVVVGGFEFPTMSHVWLAQERRGARVLRAGAPDDDALPVDRYALPVTARTRVIAATHVCFRNGYRLDIPRLVSLGREHGALVMLDDYQHTGTAPLDVRALGVDVMVTGALKYLLGPPGIAFLYVRRGLIDELEPLVTGWFGRVEPFAFSLGPLDWSPTARRFEAGSPPVPNAYAALAGLELLRELGPDVAAAQIARLAGRFADGARERGFDVVTPADPARRGALVVLRSPDATELVARLGARGIVASARGTGVRVSFHAYNDDQDVDAVLDALEAHRSLLPRPSPQLSRPD